MKRYKDKIIRFLRWTQKYTKTDMVYLAKGGFWLALGQIVSTAILFVLGLAYANLWDPVSYGNYKYILSIVGALNIFTLTGMGTAVTQAVARGFDGSFYSATKERLKWGSLGSLVAIALSGYYFYKGNLKLSLPLLISALFLPLTNSFSVYQYYLTGKKKFKLVTQYKNLSEVFSALVLIVTLFLTKNLFYLIASYFISHVLANFFFYIKTKSELQLNKKEDPKTISFGKHLSILKLIGPIANNLDSLLIFHYLGAPEVAIYSFAMVLPEKIRGLLTNIQSLALPKLAEKNKKEIKKTIFEKTPHLIATSLLVLIVYLVVSPFLYRIFFPQYLNSIPYSRVFAIAFLANSSLSIAALDAKMAIKERYIFTVFFHSSKIILMFVLVLHFGLWGIIIGRLAAKFLSFVLSLLLLKKI